VSATGLGFCAASSQVGEDFLERGDLAEPDVVPGLGEPGLGVGGHLLKPSLLGGVDAQEPAAGTGFAELSRRSSFRRTAKESALAPFS